MQPDGPGTHSVGHISRDLPEAHARAVRQNEPAALRAESRMAAADGISATPMLLGCIMSRAAV